MMTRTWKKLPVTAIVLILSVASFTGLHAEEVRGINGFLVKSELYIWNRLADFLEMARGGIAVGPAIGAEIAITERAQLGAYIARERGVSFPHFLPPLWLVPYLEEQPITRTHSGYYKTYSYGPNRYENSVLEEERFVRDPKDIRAQLGLGIAQVYGDVQTREVKDFFLGIVGADPRNDDEELDPTARREPVRQLGRGLANVFSCPLEVPMNMIRVNKERGDFAGASWGLVEGVCRFAQRGGVGLLEIVTFPMGWEPIVEPEYILEPGRNTDWRINKPAFRDRY